MEAEKRSERVTGVSNIAYDLLVILGNKLQGLLSQHLGSGQKAKAA